jgi:glucose-1-phosphate cytidylyltransferase
MINTKPMQAVILAGGKGTRISEESMFRPKPMIEIGGMPILLHIMKIYASHGIKEFIICAGYKQQYIKEYFANYKLFSSDVTIDIHNNEKHIEFHSTEMDDWKITIANTGEETMTGGRLKRVAKYLHNDRPFCLTYGDGVSDINITKLVAHHKLHGKLATVTGVIPTARFGALDFDQSGKVNKFMEKPKDEGGFINGGFFVFEPKVVEYIQDDETILEREPLENLAKNGELMVHLHHGFWQPMDTLRDKNSLEEKWESGNAPWKVWK